MNDKAFSHYIKLFSAGAVIGCHQKPERSFMVGNWQFPVCARCTGVLAGQAVMVLLLLLGVRMPLWLGLVFLFIMFCDWALQFMNLLPSTNGRRFLTGLLAGCGLTAVYFHVFVQVVAFVVALFR